MLRFKGRQISFFTHRLNKITMEKSIGLTSIFCVMYFCVINYCTGQGFYLETHVGHDLFEQKLISSQRINNVAIFPAQENLGEPLYGIKIGSNIFNKLSWQLKLDFGWALYSFSILDLAENCNFCPVRKVLTTGGKRFDFSISPRYNLFKIKNFQAFGYAGFSLSRTQKPKERIFSFNGKHLRTAEMAMLINESFGKSIFLYNLGLALEYKRITLDLSFYKQLSNSTSRGVFFEGEFHQFINRQNVTALTVGYKIIEK